jgi:hypothetical protein
MHPLYESRQSRPSRLARRDFMSDEIRTTNSRTAFFSILVGYLFVIPHVQLVDFEEVHNRFSAGC